MTRRGRHVGTALRVRREPRYCPWNCAPTRRTTRCLRLWRRLSLRRWVRMWPPALHLGPVGAAKVRLEAGAGVEEEAAEAGEAVGSVEAAAGAATAEGAAAAEVAEAAEAAEEWAEAAAAAEPGRVHPLTRRRRRSRTEVRGRARSEFAAAGTSFLLSTLDGAEKVRGKRRSNAQPFAQPSPRRL